MTTKKTDVNADKEIEQLLGSQDSLAQYHKLVEDLWQRAFKGKIGVNAIRAKQEFEDKVLEAFSNSTHDKFAEIKPDQDGDFKPVEIKSTMTVDGVIIDTKVIEENEECEIDSDKSYADNIHKHIIQMTQDGSKIGEINHWLTEALNIEDSITGNGEGSDVEKLKRYKDFILEGSVNKILGGEKVDKVLAWIRQRESVSKEEKLSFIDKLEHVPIIDTEMFKKDWEKRKAVEAEMQKTELPNGVVALSSEMEGSSERVKIGSKKWNEDIKKGFFSQVNRKAKYKDFGADLGHVIIETPKFKDFRDAAVEGSDAYKTMMAEGKRLSLGVLRDRMKRNADEMFNRIIAAVGLHLFTFCLGLGTWILGLGETWKITIYSLMAGYTFFYVLLSIKAYECIKIQEKIEGVEKKYEGLER